MYYYSAFHLSIASTIHIPFLKDGPSKTDIDLVICKKEHQDSYQYVSFLGMKYNGEIRAYETDIGTVLSYFSSISLLVSNDGKCIFIICEDSDLLEALLYCFTAGIIIALYYRQCVVFHGSSFEYKGKVHALLGNSGMGKSTLLMHLLTKRVKAFSDDIVPVDSMSITRPNGGLPFKLCDDMIDRVNAMVSQKTRLIDGLDKYWILLKSGLQYDGNPIDIQTIFVLNPQYSETNIEIKELSLTEFVKEIVPNLHAYWCLPQKLKKRVIDQLNFLRRRIRFVKITYEKTYKAIDTVSTEIMNYLDSAMLT